MAYKDAEGNEPMLPGMPARLFVATPTKLLTFADCKRKYRYSYLETPRPPKGPPWAHNTVGASVHETLADFWRWPVSRRTPEEAVDRLRANWRHEGFRDDEQSARWRERSAEMVSSYLTSVDPYAEPRGVERTVSFTTARASLRGRVDRIDERPARSGEGTELAIVDYKTGRGGRAVPARAVPAVRLVRLRTAVPAGPPGRPAARTLGRPRRGSPPAGRRMTPRPVALNAWAGGGASR